MFLCVKCILVNKIAANLKCSVYNFSLITPYQSFFWFFFVKNVHLLTLREGVRPWSQWIVWQLLGKLFASDPKRFCYWNSRLAKQLCCALCPVTGRRDKCQLCLEGKCWVSVRTCSVFVLCNRWVKGAQSRPEFLRSGLFTQACGWECCQDGVDLSRSQA